jgi:hypothetical protein
MSSEYTKIVKVTQRGNIPINSLADAIEMSGRMAKSGLVPRGMDSPEKILVAIQMGMEFGLAPLQAVRSLVVINGMPTWKGDSALGLVRASGKMRGFNTGQEKNGEDSCVWVESSRSDDPTVRRHEFSIAKAKRAGLWGKTGPWSQYPDRMLYYRALGFHLRDVYPDVLCGMTIAEEAIDIPSTERTAPDATPPTQLDPLLDGVIEGEVTEPTTTSEEPTNGAA